ncbi:MAG: hypothetical protein Q8O42_00930 [Acidobacteriota bacterium]|nr:hypothetical protein [Acidobacteriota bacterium]
MGWAGITNGAVFALAVLAAGCAAPNRSVTAGFWFEATSYTSAGLGTLTAADLVTIDTVARAELHTAFEGLSIVLSDRRDARYRVVVTQDLRDERMKREMSVAGASRAIAGLGGSGAVSLAFLAAAAEVYAPKDSSRATIVDGIGRGIGRVAAHEFAHQLLPDVPIHDSRDPATFEYGAANRPEQYFGTLRWGFAGPLLREKFGRPPRPSSRRFDADSPNGPALQSAGFNLRLFPLCGTRAHR